MSKPARHGTYDIFLEYDSDKVGFNLVTGEADTVAYSQSLAPALAPRVDNTAFTFSSVPPEIKVPVAFEDWVGGASYTYSSLNSPSVYNQGLQVDGSTSGKLTPTGETHNYWSKSGNVAPNSTSATYFGDYYQLPVGYGKVVHTALGTFMLMNEVWRWEVHGSYWERVANISDTTIPMDIVEYGGYVWISCVYKANRQGAFYLYSSNGTAFTQSAVANDDQLYYCVRGQTTGNPIIWGIDWEGNLRNNTAPASVWSGVITVGTLREDVTGLLEHMDTIYVFKTNGIYKMNSAATGSEDVWLGAKNIDDHRNGSNPVLHTDNKIYVSYDGELIQFDPIANTIIPVFPMDVNNIYSGAINSITSDGQWLYLAFEFDWTFGETHETSTYDYRDNHYTHILKGDPSVGGWHPITYSQYGSVRGMGVSPRGATNSTNPELHMLMAYNRTKIIPPFIPSLSNQLNDMVLTLPKLGEDWASDPDASSMTINSNSYVWGPWVDVGAANVDKYLASVQTIVDNASDGNWWQLYWQFDNGIYDRTLGAVGGGQVWIDLDTGSPFSDAYWPLEEPFIKRTNDGNIMSGGSLERWRSIRYVLRYEAGSSAHASVRSLVMDSALLPERVRIWNLQVVVANDQELRGGGKMREGSIRQRNFLFEAPNKQVTFYDRNGQQYIVKIQDIQSIGTFRGESSDREIFNVSLSELVPSTLTAPLLSWGEGAWDNGQRLSTPMTAPNV
jgi:hypothetical protein